jgi:soluble cytochrome b562
MLGTIMTGLDAVSGLAGLISNATATNKSSNSNNSGSDFAAMLAQAQQASESSATAEPDELLSEFQKNLRDFREQLEKLLEQLGVDTNGQPLQIQLNVLNQLCVSGKHPQLDEVQNAVQQDPQLTELFSKLQQQAAQLEARQNPNAKSDPAKPFALQVDGPQVTQVRYEIT